MAKTIVGPQLATVSQATIDAAIADGNSLIAQGKSKVEAATQIYRALKDQPQQVVVDAFISGASLTSRGALTYWYNCRRKFGRERREPAPKSDKRI